MEEIILAGRTVRYRVRVSARARRAGLRIGAEGVEVVLPRRAAAVSAGALLRQHADWVLRTLDRHERQAQARPRPPPGTLLFEGRLMRLEPAPLGTHWMLRPADGGADAAKEPAHYVPSDGAHSLLRWLCAQAAERLNERVAARGKEMGLLPRRVSLRNQRARWASCSGRGTLSFNWRLIQAPPSVLDYVVVHELAHLAHPDHSPNFWALVRRHAPSCAHARAWLRGHGWLLRADGGALAEG